MDDQYQTYVNRVVRLTLPETYRSQVQHIQSSPKFEITAAGEWQPVPFPGYSIITPPWGDGDNPDFHTGLKELQHQLLNQLDAGLVISVPPESFHFTIADLIWDSAYRHATATPGFEAQLQERLTEIFQHFQAKVTRQPIRWQPIGLVVMTRAIAVALVPKDESSYEQIVQFRRAIYQDSGLIALGIEQQYYFTAHVTLGYFGQLPTGLDEGSENGASVNRIGQQLSDLNRAWLDSHPAEFQVQRVELRKFDDMTHFYRQDDWPVLQF